MRPNDKGDVARIGSFLIPVHTEGTVRRLDGEGIVAACSTPATDGAVVDTVEFSDLFEAVGIDVAVSPREATAEEITRFTRGRRAENVSLIEGDRAEVMEFEVDADGDAVGCSIRDLAAELPNGVVFGAITRDHELITPRGDTVIEVGDHIVVFADADAVEAVTAAL